MDIPNTVTSGQATGDRPYIRKLRYLMQWLVLGIIIYGGFSLYAFFRVVGAGMVPSTAKPLSIEGFMPIGALMALKLWLLEGVFDPVHPAALVIFIGALLLAFLLKKGFCGWICPVGTVSEVVWKTGRRIFGRNFRLPVYVDYPLRSLKYLLMAFFVYAILIKMNTKAIFSFLFTPYWKVADVKLLLFFTDMSTLTMVILLVLFVLSIFIKNFWCRYLCPYGALLGLLSILSPAKIARDESKCIHCHRCTRSCPSLIPVEEKERVTSPECMACLTCVSHCPSRGALDMAFAGRGWMHPLLVTGLIIFIFWGSIFIARATGHWESNVTFEEYKAIAPHLRVLEHP